MELSRNSYPSDYRMAFAFSSVPLPAIPTTLLAESPASTRRNVGFIMFCLNNADDLAPASAPAVVLSVHLHTESKCLTAYRFGSEPVSVFGSLQLTMLAAIHMCWACHPV